MFEDIVLVKLANKGASLMNCWKQWRTDESADILCPSHGMFTTCSQYFHYMFFIYMFTICSLYICSLYVHFLYVHYIFTICSLYICSLYVRYIFTIYSLYVHYMLAIYSLYVQKKFFWCVLALNQFVRNVS